MQVKNTSKFHAWRWPQSITLWKNKVFTSTKWGMMGWAIPSLSRLLTSAIHSLRKITQFKSSWSTRRLLSCSSMRLKLMKKAGSLVSFKCYPSLSTWQSRLDLALFLKKWSLRVKMKFLVPTLTRTDLPSIGSIKNCGKRGEARPIRRKKWCQNSLSNTQC